MQQARAALVADDADRALARFRAARADFAAASSTSGSGPLALARLLPLAGSNVAVVHALADAGVETARAGIVVATAVRSLPQGLATLAPSNGRIPLEHLPALADAVARARGLASSALRQVRGVGEPSFLLPPVEDARLQAASTLGELDRDLGAAATVLDRLPSFLGAAQPRTYFFGAENPAELRGTGGLIGAYALLRADHGRISFSPFQPIQHLPVLNVADLPPPNPDYARLYDPQRAGKGFWLNVNMTPDFPSAAQALEIAFERATGERVDGVLTADPFALRALLRATGPARVPGLHTTVSANSVVAFLANGAYSRIEDSAERKLVLGAVAESVFGRFLGGAGSADAVRLLGKAAAEGHVKVFVNDATLQPALVATGAGSAFDPPEPGRPIDFLSVVVNNGAGNKVDFYVDREVRYDVTLHDDTTGSATVQVELANHAPTSGQPAYVIGPNYELTDRPGEDVSILNAYCGRCRLRSATRNGRPFDAGADHELGSNFFQDYVKLPAGRTSTTRFAYDLSPVWSGDARGGTYTLRFLNQPTIRPTTLQLRIRAPEGMHVTGASDGVRVDGDVATWRGTPERSLTVEVSFAPPLLQRLWRGLFS